MANTKNKTIDKKRVGQAYSKAMRMAFAEHELSWSYDEFLSRVDKYARQLLEEEKGNLK